MMTKIRKYVAYPVWALFIIVGTIAAGISLAAGLIDGSTTLREFFSTED